MINRKELKSAARAAMREAKPHPFWVTLVAAAIVAVLYGLSVYLNDSISYYAELITSSAESDYLSLLESGSSTGGFGGILVLALAIMMQIVSVGYVLYCLRVSRHIPASFGDIFDGFGIFFRIIVMRILKEAIYFLCEIAAGIAIVVIMSLVEVIFLLNAPEDALLQFITSPVFLVIVIVLMMIPVIIISYFYRLADYFMLDNRGVSCIQCLKMSRLAMKGRKWELFKLDLSFIGWYLLSVVPFVALWVQPYLTITEAGFYDTVAPAFLREQEERLRQQAQQYAQWRYPGQNVGTPPAAPPAPPAPEAPEEPQSDAHDRPDETAEVPPENRESNRNWYDQE